jgi:hypothetical protein
MAVDSGSVRNALLAHLLRADPTMMLLVSIVALTALIWIGSEL